MEMYGPGLARAHLLWHVSGVGMHEGLPLRVACVRQSDITPFPGEPVMLSDKVAWQAKVKDYPYHSKPIEALPQ